MLILLPPSETKRDGGYGPPLALDTLRFPELGSARRRAVKTLESLARDPEVAARALRLGPRQGGEVERNRVLRSSPTMPALDRYTGVLFDALDAGSLGAPARAFAGRHLLVHSALFGVLGAGDLIPAYRLSHDSRLPDLPLKGLWSAAVSAVLASRPGLLLDLRSEGYVALGPAPRRADVAHLRVLTRDGSGQRRALNHFNKRSKGLLVRAMLESGVVHEDLGSLCEWARAAGFDLSLRDGGLELVVTPDSVFA